MDNKIITGGGLMPSTINTPIDVRTRVETVDDIYNIELPYVGMIVYVIDEDKYYRIKSLKDKIFKGETEADYTIIMQDAIVDTFEKFNYATEDMVIALQQEVAELRALIEELKNSSTPSTPSTPSTYTPNVITVDDNLKYAIANRELSSEDNTLKNYIKGTDITGLFIWPRIQRDIDLCYIVFSINADNNHYYTEEYPYDNGIEKIFELHDLTINIINESLNINLSFTADKISMNSYCEYSIETGATLEDQEKIQKLRNEYDINNRPICNISGTLYARYAPPTDQNEYRLIKMEYSTILGDRSQY